MKFEDFIDVRDGTHDSPKAVEDGVYLLTTKGLKNQKIDFEGLKKVSFQDAKKINERSIVEQYDILLSMIGTVGNVYQERKSSVPYVIKNVALLKFHGDKVLSDWIYYYLLSPSGQQQINLRKKGSTQQFISLKDIRNISVDLPSRSEMKLLVKKLNVVNDKILLNEQINDNLLDVAQLIFNSMFPNVNYGTQTIGELTKNFDKFRKPLSKKQRIEIQGNYRYIGATSVNDYISKYNFDGIYLLLAEDGSVQDNNGFPILQYVFGKFWPNNHTHVLQGNNISTEWLYLFFRQHKVSELVTGAVQPKISQSNLNKISITAPTEEEKEIFSTRTDNIFSLIRQNELQSTKLLMLKNLLLSKYF
ncbi:restriction endonuclease subunit S [Lactobacillus delbrueckii subsp. bulgaricus]|uniref:restriction endonuclease subunit S n=1 Tax=Lactobacillus delbrueckii TaxID=1584 RepID=UPI0012E2E093|nr:restriction endonuclease subunit S [Lactobacillus delbrueckii]MBT9003050.1 hypothetical protein [Lactobacillus delbrueckii subsp. bulgaricus]QGT62022.1 hypothetical protein GM421_09150 [Lactobacillus delbrueckii]